MPVDEPKNLGEDRRMSIASNKTLKAGILTLSVVMLGACTHSPFEADAPSAPSGHTEQSTGSSSANSNEDAETSDSSSIVGDSGALSSQKMFSVDEGRASVPERGGDGCQGLPSLEPRLDSDPERVVGYWYSELRDVGSIAGATGTVILREDGQPAAYIVADGDNLSSIARRFCIDHYPYLEWINAIRRGSGTSLTRASSMTVFAGDTINLDAHTIATVGDENGRVHNNAIDFHIPPQD